MAEENFEIKLPQFEGPFDLLLFFIERDELDIHDIPIARITDDFLNYIHQMNRLNMELASEFIYVAATLMRSMGGHVSAAPAIAASHSSQSSRQAAQCTFDVGARSGH